MTRTSVVLLVGAALMAGACDRGAEGTSGAEPAVGPALATLDSLPSPAGAFSGEPNLHAGPDGIYLSWLEQSAPDRYALRYSRWEDGWGETRQVMDREGLFVNWADFPALAVLEDGTVAAHWLEKSGSGPYAYDVRMALSGDGGAHWSEDVIPHRDGVEAEHGFVSLMPLDGEVAVTWLDGRETVDGDPMTIRFTTVGPGGELGPGVLLDSSACDCCQTGMARTDQGPIVVYRDRTEEEVRDVYVTRRVDGAWSEPRPVHDDGWVIPGCPVNGPSIDAHGRQVAVAWFTGAPVSADAGRDAVRAAGDRGRVLAAFSDDGGETFGPPVRVDDGAAMGRVDVELLDDGSALVLWLERVEGAAEVRLRKVTAEAVGPARSITGTEAQRASGFPRMALRGKRLILAWTEPGETPRVRTALGTLADPDAGTEVGVATGAER